MSDTPRDEARVDRFNALGAAAFERLGEVTPADDALLDRLVDHAMQAPPAAASPTTAGTKLGAKLVAGLAIGGAIVGAALLMRSPEPNTPAPVAAPVAPASPDVEPPPAPPEEPPAVVMPTPRTEPPAPARAPTTSAKTPKAPAQPAPTHEDAAALLLAANQARRANQPDRARDLYRELARRFPGSREHRISEVALGDLELESFHRPARALEQYQSYLGAKPKGNLAEEALYGKARALDQLGRRSEAAQAWSTLVERFPDSLHAKAAARRLAE